MTDPLNPWFEGWHLVLQRCLGPLYAPQAAAPLALSLLLGAFGLVGAAQGVDNSTVLLSVSVGVAAVGLAPVALMELRWRAGGLLDLARGESDD